MRKRILILTLIISCFYLSSYQYIDNSGDYLIINNDPSSASFYQYGKSSYLDYFSENNFEMNNLKYSIRIRKYSWNDQDTAYFRKGIDNFYSLDIKTGIESIVIPINPQIGQKWFEADSSWSYEVLRVDEIFKTPVARYKNCVLVECKQLTNRDIEKSSKYHLYYSKGNGYVGNLDVNNNKILSYLKEVVKNAETGTKIGK